MAKSTFLDFSTTAGDNTDCGGIGILGTNSVSNFDNAFRTLMAILRRDLDNGTVFVTKSGAYTAVANDNNAFYEFTAAATLTLTAAATLGADWHMMVFANGGDVTIDADGTELINGAETLVVSDGDAAYLICTGSAFVAIAIPGVAGVAKLETVNTFTKTQVWSKGADIASAAALTLGDDGNYFDVTGTTAITSIATVGVGTVIKLHFDGALTLTHHSADLVLPGAANITTAAGDEAEFVEYAAGDWRCTSYQRASGKAISGGIIQVQSQFTGAVATGTTLIPNDDTIPQITEGDEYLTVTITPTSATSILEIDVQIAGSLNSGAISAMALFKVGTSDALCATYFGANGSGILGVGTLGWRIVAGSTSAQTFKVRAGPSSAAATFTFNGSAGARRFGGVMNSFLVVKEIAP